MAKMYRARKALDANADSLLCKKNVVGVGVGKRVKNGRVEDPEAVIVLVEKKVPLSELSEQDMIPAVVERLGDKVKTDVVEIGHVVAEQYFGAQTSTSNKNRERPIVGGVSCGHYDVTAGTVGCFVERDGNVYILSNNHVIANVNDCQVGDPIIQPGNADGGNNPDDVVALLSDWVVVDFNRPNLTDCALARVVKLGDGDQNDEEDDLDEVPERPPEPPKPPVDIFDRFWRWVENLFRGRRRRFSVETVKRLNEEHQEFVTKFNGVDPGTYVPGVYGEDYRLAVRDIVATGELAEVNVGDRVQKTGRTTGYTTGEVTATDVVVNVDFGQGRVARFEDQILLTNMSKGGDSGSAVFNENGDLVGLLFAGSNTVTIANKIEHVIDELEIDRVLFDQGVI